MIIKLICEICSIWVSMQCQCNPLWTKEIIREKPKENSIQVSIEQEADGNLLAYVECFKDCSLTSAYYRSSDGGEIWKALPDYKLPDFNSPVYGTHLGKDNAIYRLTSEGEGYKKEWFLDKSINMGQKWIRQNAIWRGLGVRIKSFVDIKYNSSEKDTVFALVHFRGTLRDSRALFLTRDGGETFDYILGDVADFAICEANPSILFAITLQGQVLKSNNLGKEWVLLERTDIIRNSFLEADRTYKANQILQIDIRRDCQRVFLVTSIAILQSRDGGISWCAFDIDGRGRYTPSSFLIDIKRSQTLFIGTVDRGLFRSNDSGCTWQYIDIAKRLR